jgi:hypothetical protein
MHPLIWIALAALVGYLVGQEVVYSRWNAEKRRLRKRLGIATLEDYWHHRD